MESEPEVVDVAIEDVIDGIQTNVVDDDYGYGENNNISIESAHIGRVMRAYFCVLFSYTAVMYLLTFYTYYIAGRMVQGVFWVKVFA